MTEVCGDTQAQSSPGWLRWVTRIAVVLGLTALVTMIWIVGPTTILDHLHAIGWFFVLIIAIDVLSSVCDATAVYFMAHGPGHPRWRAAVVAQLSGRGVNAVTPGGNLGEALKIGLLSRRCSPRRIVAAVMYVGLTLAMISLVFVATGTAVTAFWFDLPRAAVSAMLAGSLLAATIVLVILVLIHRGMLVTLVDGLARVRVISRERRDRSRPMLEEVDRRLRGQGVQHRRRAFGFLLLSQALQKTLTFLVVYAAGYVLSPGQFMALVSAGALLGWISAIIPMGLGISEGGNVALFGLIGAPPSLGLALAFARRINQVVFATIGFTVLTLDRVGASVYGKVRHHGTAAALERGSPA